MASNNNEMLIDAQEVDGGIKYRYYKWEKMTNEEGLKVLKDHLERVKNGSCEGRPNVRTKVVPYTEWVYCDDWEDIKSYDDIFKDKEITNLKTTIKELNVLKDAYKKDRDKLGEQLIKLHNKYNKLEKQNRQLKDALKSKHTV